MYSNLSKSQALPLPIKFSSKPKCFKQFQNSMALYSPTGSYPKPYQKPLKNSNCAPLELGHLDVANVSWVKPLKISTEFNHSSVAVSLLVSFRSVLPRSHFTIGGLRCSLIRTRSFSSSSAQRIHAVSNVEKGDRRTLPWLVINKAKEAKRVAGARVLKTGDSTSGDWRKQDKKVSGNAYRKNAQKSSGKVGSVSSWEQSAEKLEKESLESESLSWQESQSQTTLSRKYNISQVAGSKTRNLNKVESIDNSGYSGGTSYNKEVECEEECGEEMEPNDDPRWENIKNRFRRMENVTARTERPEVQRWQKQESWARKTWKEATESSLPKMVGEGIYGVGPVLAALSAGRREFYAIYVQEGLDLSSNNRKKKESKGFDKVLRIAEKIGLAVKEASKHDLNMVVNNRPHQGLVLDASPLEMVKIKELDPVSVEEGNESLWVALDEVTDPQNLGAIVRSSYFFGASGIVLCAKNSAPLSGVVSKASAGSLELMELRYCKNMMQFLVSSAENGWRVLGGSISTKAISLNEVLPGPPTILVLGSEGTGLRPLVERSCTQLVRIHGNIPVDISASRFDGESAVAESSCKEFQSFLAVESLNVSVAAGVLLHHLIGYKNKDHGLVNDKQTDALQSSSQIIE